MSVSRFFRIGRRRLRSISRKNEMDSELNAELGFHFEQLVRENVTAGMSLAEARRAARRTLGNIPLLAEQCRDQRRVTWVHDFFQDFRYALRQFAKERGVAIVLVLTIALGIGVNTTIFSMANGVMRPLPVRSPEQIVVLAAQTKGDEVGFAYRFSYPALEDVRREAEPFSDVFGFALEIDGFSTGGRPTQFVYSAVTGNFFSALGVKPAAGRLFQPGEGENAGSDLTVVLGYTFWQKRFGGNPAIVGQLVRIGGTAATVIGVAPEEFHGVFEGADMDGYMTLRSITDPKNLFTSRTDRSLTLLGRRKAGVTLQKAQASMNLLAQRMQQAYPATEKGIGIRVIPEILARPVPLSFLPDVLPVMRIFLLAMAVLVLALACMNVANVLLARATARGREMAIRTALGSGRGRLIRQMLTESLLLASLGAAAGMVLGMWTASAIASSLNANTDWPVRLDFSFDWRVFTYSLAAAVFTGLFTGIWPALRASQAEPVTALHDGGRDSGRPERHRMRSLLVATQVAGSLVLLISAGLSARSLRNAQKLNLGFAPDHLLNARMDPQWAGYEAHRTKDFYRELELRVRRWPEVQSVSLAFSVPMGPFSAGWSVYVDGRPVPKGQQVPVTLCNYVGPGYFDTMRIPILRGRAFRESDDEESPLVAIVNQNMANRYWPGQNPIGKRFRPKSPDAPPVEIVGVAQDGKYNLLFEPPLPYFYLPLSQNFVDMRVLQIRTSVDPESLKTRLDQEIHTLDPNIPVSDMQTMQQSLEGLQGFIIFRIGAIQSGALGLLGLALALVGVYGVVSYAAARQTREIGIRMALGATPRHILRIVLGRGAWMIAAGLVAGWLGAAALSGVVGRIMPFASPRDPFSFIVIPALLAAVALSACYIPARRAMRVDPSEALRLE